MVLQDLNKTVSSSNEKLLVLRDQPMNFVSPLFSMILTFCDMPPET